jgi:hypothetical protein
VNWFFISRFTFHFLPPPNETRAATLGGHRPASAASLVNVVGLAGALIATLIMRETNCRNIWAEKIAKEPHP